jgi:hypothetical protein
LGGLFGENQLKERYTACPPCHCDRRRAILFTEHEIKYQDLILADEPV